MIKLVHIYGQDQWHDSVYIVGNNEGLHALRNALNDALLGGNAKAEVFTSDGEGYHICVMQQDTDWQGEFWSKLRLPYWYEEAANVSQETVYPEDLPTFQELQKQLDRT